MPGENCSMYGCGTCCRPKYKGMGIFQVPEYREGPGNDAHRKWRNDFLKQITASRVVDAPFKYQIKITIFTHVNCISVLKIIIPVSTTINYF